MKSFDNCPRCGRLIRDYDMTGREEPNGQRWCVEHRPPVRLCAECCGLLAEEGLEQLGIIEIRDRLAEAGVRLCRRP